MRLGVVSGDHEVTRTIVREELHSNGFRRIDTGGIMTFECGNGASIPDHIWTNMPNDDMFGTTHEEDYMLSDHLPISISLVHDVDEERLKQDRTHKMHYIRYNLRRLKDEETAQYTPGLYLIDPLWPKHPSCGT